MTVKEKEKQFESVINSLLAQKTLKTEKMKEPQMEDFYDELDPRGISSTEYNEYLKALEEYERSTRGNLV